jgi:hypothetical protein
MTSGRMIRVMTFLSVLSGRGRPGEQTSFSRMLTADGPTTERDTQES